MDGFMPVLYRSGYDLDLSGDDYPEEYYYDDVELIYDLEDPVPVASGSDWFATSSQTGPVTLVTIHEDIQLLIFTILMIYVILFVLFIIRKWR